MKKKIIAILIVSFLSVSLFSCKNESVHYKKEISKENISTEKAELPDLSSPSMTDYSTDYFTMSYDDNIYKVISSQDEHSSYHKVTCSYIDDVSEDKYNTICAVIENHSFYEMVGNKNAEDALSNFGTQIFNSQNKPVVSSDTSEENGCIETHVVLDDGSEYYIKLLSLNPDTSIIAALRMCEYTSYFNNSLYDIYSSVTAKNFAESYPVVSYSDIQSGKYNGQRVIIEATVDNVKINSNSSNFSLWFPNGESFAYVPSNISYNISPASSDSCFLTLKNGDILRYATEIHQDGSFGTSSVFFSEIIGNRNIEEIRTVFKSSCPLMNYNELNRNPDSHKNEVLQVSGKIFQVISESDYSAEYLLSNENGYTYVNWYSDKEMRGSRILEGDSVTIYGSFEGLKTYNTLSGEKTVPSISTNFVDLK